MTLSRDQGDKHQNKPMKKSANKEKQRKNKNVFRIWNFTIFWID